MKIKERDMETSETCRTKTGSAAMSRRAFVGGLMGAAGTMAVGSLAACAPQQQAEGQAKPETGESSPKPGDDWLGAEPTIDDIAETIETDVLVVGAGTGGMFAACSAAEEGASVIVLEKTETGANVRGDLGAMNSRYQHADGCKIDEQEFQWDMYRFASGSCSYALRRTWMEHSGEAVDWYGDVLADNDVTMWHEAASEDPSKLSLVRHWPIGHSPEWPVGEDGTPKLSGAVVLQAYAESKGTEFMYNTAMMKLVVEDGSVKGAIAQRDDGSYLRIDASKGVIVATGGYGRNNDMLAALQPETMETYSLSIAMEGATGDGIKACLWAGAAMDPIHSSMLFDRCALPPDALAGWETEGGTFFNMGSHPWLKVNLNGERFANEGSGVYDFILHAATLQPSGTYCTVFDSNWKAYAEQADMHGCARMFPYENGAPANQTAEDIEAANARLLESGHLQQADTLEELAEKLGIPADAFKATVKRYNESCAAGVDSEFGKEAHRLSPVDAPPYYGLRNTGILLCTMDGIRINTDMQALRADGSPIEGLYVVGNDSGCYFASSYPNTATGAAAGRTLTFGRRAGKIVAAK